MTEKNLPVTLRERMNDDGEIFIFHEWFQGYSSKMGNPSITLQLYDKDSSRWVSTRENPDLRAAIQRYLETEPASDFWDNFDPDSCSWDQVFAELEDTKTVYRSKADGNPIRRCFRHGQGFSRNMMPLLESIPQDDGLGLLKGGLQIIFNAVKRRTDTCEKIFASFEHIPSCIVDAEQLRRSYPQDESLFTAINNLYDQLIKSIPPLIDILLRKSNSSSGPPKFSAMVFCARVSQYQRSKVKGLNLALTLSIIDDILTVRASLIEDLLLLLLKDWCSANDELKCVVDASRRVEIPKWTMRLLP